MPQVNAPHIPEIISSGIVPEMLEDFSQEEFDRWIDSLDPYDRRLLVHSLDGGAQFGPVTGPQMMAYSSPADLLGLGGQAGGGKTFTLCLLAVNKYPTSLIFRETEKDTISILKECARVYGSSEGLSVQDKKFEPKGSWFKGHKIDGGGLGPSAEWTKWQGKEHALICFDEVVNLPYEGVRRVMNWNRSGDLDKPYKTRTVWTWNPPDEEDPITGKGAQYDYVMDVFGPWIDEENPRYPTPDGKILYYRPPHWWEGDDPDRRFGTLVDEWRYYEIDAGEGMKEFSLPETRTFIRMKPEQNKFIGREYKSKLLWEPDNEMRRKLTFGKHKRIGRDVETKIIREQWVREAVDRHEKNATSRVKGLRQQAMREGMTCLGCDVAHMGNDWTCLIGRYGLWWDHPKLKHNLKGGVDVVNFIQQEMRDGAEIIFDEGGIGAGVSAVFRERNFMATGVNVARSPGAYRLHGLAGDGAEPYNARAALALLARRLFDPINEFEIAIPNHRRLIDELCDLRWAERAGGRLVVESKKEIKERTGRSTDVLDAFLLSLVNIFETDRHTSKILRKGGKTAHLHRIEAALSSYDEGCRATGGF